MDRRRRHIINLIASAVVVVVCIIIIIVSFHIKNQLENEYAHPTNPDYGTSDDDPTNPPTSNQPNQPSDITEITETRFIDLQPTVDNWLKTLANDEEVGLMIYDINNSRTAASYQADKVFDVASVYKLLFAYDGYHQIAIGAENPNDILTTTSDKGGLTVAKCLDLIIRESYNGCADVMNRDAKRISRVNTLIRELGMANTDDYGLKSTASDITKLLRHYWRHTELNPTLWDQLSDSMLNQPPSYVDEDSRTYDWRQGLPAGFSQNVKVYNKVGWDWNGTSWNIYADAAIADFTNLNRTYTIAVLTKNLSSYAKISQLGTMIEDAVETASQTVIK